MATCMICGKEYEVCKKCPETTKYTPWRKMCDTEEHFQLLMIYQELRDGVITDNEAKEQLERLKIKVEDIKELYEVVQKAFLPLFESKAQKPQPKKKYEKYDKKFEKPEQIKEEVKEDIDDIIGE